MISNRLIIASSVLLVSVVSVVAIVVSRSEPKKISPTAGCGSKPSWTFNAENHYNHTIGDRSFLVHIPAKYNFSMTHPVVLSFHGYGEDGLEQERISGFSEEGNLIDGKVGSNRVFGSGFSDLKRTD